MYLVLEAASERNTRASAVVVDCTDKQLQSCQVAAAFCCWCCLKLYLIALTIFMQNVSK